MSVDSSARDMTNRLSAGTAPIIWVTGVVVAFLPLGIAALLLASRTLDGFELVGANREWVVGAHALVWAALMLIAVQALGKGLGLLRSNRLTMRSMIPFALATTLAYGIALDARLSADAGFDSEHTFPQILVVLGLITVGTASVGMSGARPAAAVAWRWAVVAAWIVLVVLTLPTIVLSVLTFSAYSGSMSTGALLAIAVAVLYGVGTALSARRASRRSHPQPERPS